MQQLQNVRTQAQEFRTASLARASQSDVNDPFDPPRTRRHDHDPVAHVDRFVHVVRHQQHRCATRLPEAQHLVLHPHPREGVQRAKRFIQQQQFRMIDQMVRVSVGKSFQTHQPHELIHFMPFLVQQTARDKSRLDIVANVQPREKIRILKHQPPFRARPTDRLVTDPKLTRIWKIQPRNQTKQRRFPTSARPHDRYQLPSRDRKRHPAQRFRAHGRIVRRRKILCDIQHAQRAAFRRWISRAHAYHLMIPFCQTSTRSRTLNSSVMIVEKNAAMITSAA